MPAVESRTEGADRSPCPKCVVWDLDGTLWEGRLAENAAVRPLPERMAMIRELDRLGVLQSIASRNDMAAAHAALHRCGLAEYFLHPQIHWGHKSDSLLEIARALNVDPGSLVLVDDDPYERAEVRAALGYARVVGPGEMPGLVNGWLEDAGRVTEEGGRRRHAYMADMARDDAEQRFVGPRSEFLSWLGVGMSIRRARPSDMARVRELAERANQMSSAGRRAGGEWIERRLTLPGHHVVLAGLQDRFGDYGTIGFALLRSAGPVRRLLLYVVSCRVMNRGAGMIFLNWMLREAGARGERMEVEFGQTPANRPLYVTFRFAGFKEIGREGDLDILAHDGRTIHPRPSHVSIDVGEDAW